MYQKRYLICPQNSDIFGSDGYLSNMILFFNFFLIINERSKDKVKKKTKSVEQIIHKSELIQRFQVKFLIQLFLILFTLGIS